MSIRDNEIMEAALNLFANKGYTSVSTKEIAQAAGITEMTLFRRFESKKKLFIRCVFQENEIDDFIPKIDLIPVDDARAAFSALAECMASSFCRQNRFTKILSSCPEVHDEEFRALARERLISFQDAIRRFLKRLVEAGRLVSQDPEGDGASCFDVDIATIALVAQISGFFFLKEVGKLSPNLSWEEILKRCIVAYGEALHFQ